MYDQTRADQTPWRDAGTNALAQLTSGTSQGGSLMRPFTMSDYQADPGYSFRLSEGMKGLERSAAARGGLLSGAALKGITRYNQDMGSQEYQNAYNRFNQDQSTQYNRLASMAGLGQTANSVNAAAGQNYATGAGNNMTGAGNATAAGQVGSANAWNNGISQGLSSYANNNMMNKLFPQNGSPWGSTYQDQTYQTPGQTLG